MSTSLKVYGLNTKIQVDLNKRGFSFYSDNIQNTYLVFDSIYQSSQTFETKNQAFIFLDRNYKHLPLQLLLKTLPVWVKHVDNWAHSDSLSKFLSRLVESSETKEKMLSHILKWNRSKNLWERRQSLVALFYYSRTKKQHLPFEFVIQLIHNLLYDKEYFVQKAVGWTLRETYNVYPKRTFEYLLENVGSLTPYAFTACTEKMSEKEKSVLKEKRGLHKSKSNKQS